MVCANRMVSGWEIFLKWVKLERGFITNLLPSKRNSQMILKQAHYELRAETSWQVTEQEIVGGTWRERQEEGNREGQVKKDEVSINRKQPYGLFTS